VLGSQMSYVDLVEAEERGRKMAERMVSTNPDARARVEAKFGVDYCKRRYPLAYQENANAGSNPGT